MPLMVKALASRCRSVALVGMDGSGKSTQANRLCRILEARQTHVLLIHPFGRKALSFVPDRLASRIRGAEKRVGRSRLAQLAAAVEMLDIAVYIWAAYIRAFAPALRTGCGAWLVSDRSFDDLLVKHRRLGTFSPGTLAAARRLVPLPQRTIWLHTEPEIAMGRDGEFEAGYYKGLHATYTFAAAQYAWDVVCTSNRSPDAVAADIERLVGLGRRRAPTADGESLSPAPGTNKMRPPEARTEDLRQS